MKDKQLSIAIIILIVLNIWLGLQYRDYLKLRQDAEETSMYLANRALSGIRGYFHLATNPKAEWQNKDYIYALNSELLLTQYMAESSQSLIHNKNKNLDDIRTLFNYYSMEINPYIEITLNVLNSKSPISEKDKNSLIELGQRLKAAGFTKQIQEDNGQNFKESMDKYLKGRGINVLR